MNIFFLLLLISISSCSSTEAEKLSSNFCSLDGAYAKGVQDGKQDLPWGDKNLSFCQSEPDFDVLSKEYNNGFYEGQLLFR